ncbi:peptidoglycan transglycosylase, partial [Vibrio vulnificus]|uniref:transglycosylase domain-containing protein n=1 Tax=Vibrio vulnificus TaxID=672 RepID=UPI000CB09AD0
KGLEAWFTLLIETLWTKQRILEVYLNSAEWRPGVFGAQDAARDHFGLDAERLIRTQASQLGAGLPRQKKWSAARPGPYV